METDMRYFMHLTAGVTQPGGGGPEVSTHHAEAVETVAGFIYSIYTVSTQYLKYLQYLHSRYLGWTVDVAAATPAPRLTQRTGLHQWR